MAAVWAFPSTAAAVAVTCPNPLQSGQNNTYTVSPAVDCVWGNGNIGSGNDAFLAGTGTNDAAYGNTGPLFGKTWTTVGANSNPGDPITGITFTNLTGTSATWTVTDTTYAFYALGVKDGSNPEWAVFLLDSATLTGTVTMTGGSFSHFVLYGSGTPTGPGPGSGAGSGQTLVPEPASLILLGSGLSAAAVSARRRRKQQKTQA